VRKYRLAGVLALVLAAAVATVALGVGRSSTPTAKQQGAARVLKGALAPGRIDKVEKGRESAREILNGPEQEAYSDRAYPLSTVRFAQTQAAEKAAEKVESRGPGHPKRWKSVGPDTLDVDTLGTQTFGPPTQWSGRVTAMAVAPSCNAHNCRLYVAAAGGGIWLANNALARHPAWQQISDGGIPTNSIGSMLIDPTDPSGRTIYVGTGEPNGSSDSEAGLGLYKSTDAGNHWSLVGGSLAVAKDRAIGAIAIDPGNRNHILIGTAVARHGLSSQSGGRYTPPGAPPVGLYSSSNGGASFTPALIRAQDPVVPGSATGGDFFRGGVTDIQYDPLNPNRLFLAMNGYGLSRSNDNGVTWESIFDSNPEYEDDPLGTRFDFDAVALPNGKTRIYLGGGSQIFNDADPPELIDASRLWRVDDASLPAAALTTGGTNSGWTSLSSSVNGTPGFASYDFCRGQCWYDQFVVSMPGRPNTVLFGGVFQYEESPLYGGPDRSNGRAVMLSTDAGEHFTDMTSDARNSSSGLLFSAETIHPDQHAIAFVPSNPDIMFVGNDGGVSRTDGTYTNDSDRCNSRGLNAVDLAECRAWLSKIPTRIFVMNEGLGTLQFQSLSVNANNPLRDVMGGTQDNGTLIYSGSPTWFLPVTGDGGDSGIDPTDANKRFHTYTNTFIDVNFRGVDPATWLWVGDTMFFAGLNGEQSAFYAPVRQDPVRGGQIFAGMQFVWRTQDTGGDQAFLEAHCNTTGVFGTSDLLFSGKCGDFARIGGATGDLVGPSWGADKGGSYTVAIERALDANTLWVGTRRGRVFVSKNASAANPDDVTYDRIDSAATPTRLPSGIAVDPNNPNHAYITFSGYNAYALAAGQATGHVFEINYNPGTHTATWTKLDKNLGDEPITDVVYDAATGDLYISTDFGVNRLAAGSSSWVPAAGGLPEVAVYGLNIADTKNGGRVIYAATHGRGAYRLKLGKVH
jgi:hypothetical protein